MFWNFQLLPQCAIKRFHILNLLLLCQQVWKGVKASTFSHINESSWVYITWHDVMGIVLLLAELWMPRAEHQRKNTTLKVFLEHIWENLLVNANTCPNKYWFAFRVNAELANLTWHEEHCVTNASFNWEILGVYWKEYIVGSMCLFGTCNNYTHSGRKVIRKYIIPK